MRVANQWKTEQQNKLSEIVRLQKQNTLREVNILLQTSNTIVCEGACNRLRRDSLVSGKSGRI